VGTPEGWMPEKTRVIWKGTGSNICSAGDPACAPARQGGGWQKERFKILL
jgi:hypothetical protein